MPTLQGVIHGRTIQLTSEPGLRDGEAVSVDIHPLQAIPAWLERFEVAPAVHPTKLVVKGTGLLVDDLVAHVEKGSGRDELSRSFPQLTPADIDAVLQYARVPVSLRRSFGGWTEEAEELDKYLAWTREQRKLQPKRFEA